ncbi:hypothetical protein HBH56_043690 [Parastagonospora nodorum]|nr:hypothetical protein HBH56_043690 [Parastagonospora nodorum]QRC92825.1 hypothetical protein JI435_081230 [Parastagonospora nodorum SN15]KAH3932978.1 hypothetical protein HBH54_071440 [Parastagonospora nodorum]KAH3946317.1 hypothetical protein HBH53_130630 [Parastagonospora nodorum]KAH4038543.1 hypothetical protein HBI09_052670 [Parastagonospora nodorum]
MTMARHGLNVQAIDITPHHVANAKKNVRGYGLQDRIKVDYANYHNLSQFPDASFDGIYTMETFVHADDPIKVLNNFKRLLKPGGVVVLHEADFSRDSDKLQDVLRLSPKHTSKGWLRRAHESGRVQRLFPRRPD